jgi:hypothetical protein
MTWGLGGTVRVVWKYEMRGTTRECEMSCMWLAVSGLERLVSDAKNIELRRKGINTRTRKMTLRRGSEGNERDFEDVWDA